MKNNIYAQLAHSSLLPDDMAAAILAGNMPLLEELVMALVIGCMDAHAVIVGDPESSGKRSVLRAIWPRMFFIGHLDSAYLAFRAGMRLQYPGGCSAG